MPVIDINDLARIGVVVDQAASQIPPEAWTHGHNVRMLDGAVERLKGYTQVFGTPSVEPHFLIPIQTASTTYWVYVSLTKAYVWNGSTHTNITRQSTGVDVDYTASLTRDWNGTLLGGVLVLNNGADIPQYWATASVGTKLANLSNWNSNIRAKVLRAFGPYLVGFNITDTGTNYPHLIQWSHPADPGSVPSSWDYTDPAVDAGRKDLPDVNAGLIREAIPLQGSMYVYKDNSIWVMRQIGGRFIFSFDTYLDQTGILAPRCVAATGDGLRHVVATQDDIIVHNGNKPESILNARMRRTVFNELDTTNFANSFMFCNSLYDEVWFCYPTTGQTYPNKAVIWNYRASEAGALTTADVSFRNAAVGVIESPDDVLWSTDSGTWGTDDGPWSESVRRRTVVADPANTLMYQMDSGNSRNTVTYTATLTREALAFVGRKRSGEWIVDYRVRKLYTRLWPKVRGGPIRVRMGTQDHHEGAIAWSDYETFDPSSQDYVDLLASGRAIALEFSSTSPIAWRLEGYRLEFQLTGNF